MGRSRLRAAILLLAGLETAGWLAVVIGLWLSGSDPATRGLDRAFAAAATLLYAVTGAPALVLALAGRALGAAAALALVLLALAAAAFGYAMLS